MKTIDERIMEHEKLRETAIDKKKRVENDLKNIDEKISYHNNAIHNLRAKKPKPKV